MWAVLPVDTPWIYEFEHSADGYTLVLSDFKHVWTENADQKMVIDRASDCVLDVVNRSHVASLGSQLEKGLKAGSVHLTATDSAYTLTLSYTLPTIDAALVWKFLLSRDSNAHSADILSTMCIGLLGALDSVSTRAHKLDSLLMQKDYHIRHMHSELVSAGAKYSPRKFRTSVDKYKSTSESRSAPWKDGAIAVIKRALNVANHNWGFTLDDTLNQLPQPHNSSFIRSLTQTSPDLVPSSQDTFYDGGTQVDSLDTEPPKTPTPTPSNPPSPLPRPTPDAHQRKRALEEELRTKQERMRKKPRF